MTDRCPPATRGPLLAPEVERLTWLSAPRRFPPGQFRIVGPLMLGVHDWSNPQRGRPRLFEQDLLEAVTCAHPALLAAIYIPASLCSLWLARRAGLPAPVVIGCAGGGLLVWTLLEYLFHRFSFHFTPRSRVGVIFAYLIHGVHHAFPDDNRRWVMPPIVTVPIAALLIAAGYWLVAGYVWPIGAGIMLGYLWYDVLHYLIHRGPMKWGPLQALRTHHLQHHYAAPEGKFGVSTTFWDHLFGTTR